MGEPGLIDLTVAVENARQLAKWKWNMSSELDDILRSPRDAPFSRIQYVMLYATEEQKAVFLRELYLAAVQAKDTGHWEQVLENLEEWEAWAMAELFSRHVVASTVEGIPWSGVSKPLNKSRIALVTTGGIYVEGQEPYDLDKQGGDFSFREISRDTPIDQLRVKHRGYDISGPEVDMNCVFPLQRLLEMEAEGAIGEMASTAYSFMGLINANTNCLIEDSAPEVARRLKQAAVDAVFITAT
jgi:D-proline reductase (dithiol) PrdB